MLVSIGAATLPGVPHAGGRAQRVGLNSATERRCRFAGFRSAGSNREYVVEYDASGEREASHRLGSTSFQLFSRWLCALSGSSKT